MFLNLHLFYVKLSFISKFRMSKIFFQWNLGSKFVIFKAQNLFTPSNVSKVKLNIKTFTLL